MGDKRFYDDVFSSGKHHQWENAPGKDVIIQAMRHYVKIGEVQRDARIVDIGCGTGFFLYRLRGEISENFHLYGVDFSEAAIAKGTALYDDFHLVCEDGAATHFPDAEFDVLVSYGVSSQRWQTLSCLVA